MVTRMPRAAAFAAAVAVAVLAAACSGEGSATTADRAAPATSAPPSTTTTTAPPTTTTTIPPCPAPRGVDGDVDVFRSAPGGACRPAGELVAYRCADRSVPAIVTGLGGDQPVDHLGGRFASTVPALPADATAVGVREDGARVLASPSDPDALFLDTGVAVTRWPALRRWTTASGAVVVGLHRPAAFFLGDSVMLGAVGAIQAAMAPWDVVVDAAVSRSTAAGVDVIRARRAEIADVVVVQLGTNDGADPGLYAERVRAVMAELAGVDLVLWLTIREARPYYATTNATLRQVLAGYPNAVVADWNATAPPGATYADGLHLRAEGAAAMAALARDAVFAWYASTVDRGPDACRPQLDAAVAGGR
jgi:lysophospholipase L1-like esterase